MKIAEIVGSVVVQPPEEVPVSSFPQRIANAFTRSGRVKRPLDLQVLGSQSMPNLEPSSSIAASDQGTSVAQSPSAVPNARMTFPTLTVDDPNPEPKSILVH